MSVWDVKGLQCPDSEYDSGGTFEPQVGICKSGVGGFIYFERKL